MEAIEVELSALTLDPNNANEHSEASINGIAQSLHSFGQPKPIVIDDRNVVLAGNGTVLAAGRIGWKSIMAVRTDLSGAKAAAYAIADNQTAKLSDFNQDKLRKQLEEIGSSSEAELLNSIGFSESDLEKLLKDDGDDKAGPKDAAPKIDQAAKLLKKWKVEPGQLWSLGDHLILCGDSTNTDDVNRLLSDGKPRLMVTDTPYGIEYDPAWRSKKLDPSIRSRGEVNSDDRASWAGAFARSPCVAAYVWHSAKMAGTVEASLVACGFEIRAQIIWVKKQAVISQGHYHWRHESAYYAVKKGENAGWQGGRKQNTVWADIIDRFNTQSPNQPALFAAQVDELSVMAFDASMTTVWEIPKDKACEGGHSTQKPVECMARPIRNNSVEGDLVYEPFSGTGTTIIACEQLGRKCRAMEIDPSYVAVALERFKEATGKVPVKL